MKPVPVIYHRDPEAWWADSPAVPGWSATAETLDELRPLVEDGVRFALGSTDVAIVHGLEPGVGLYTGVLIDFVAGRAVLLGNDTTVGTSDTDLRFAATG